MSSIDKRDIHPIADVAETSARTLRARGELAWKRAGEFDASGATSGRAPDAGSGGTRTDDDDIPIVGVDPVGDMATELADRKTSSTYHNDLRAALKALDTAASRVVDLVDELTRTKTEIKPDDPRGWCPNCRKAGVTETSAIRSDGSQRFRDRDGRCNPCITFRAANGFERPALIIQRKSEGRKLSKREADEVIARARREHELEQRKASQRLERARLARSVSDSASCASTLTSDGHEHRCELDQDHGGGVHLASCETCKRVVEWPNHARPVAVGE